MPSDPVYRWETVVGREMLMDIKTCASCGRKFNLGEPVVLAVGTWGGPPRWIHQEDAVFDRERQSYIERKCLEE